MRETADTDSQVVNCCASAPTIARHFDKRITAQTAETEFPEMVDVSTMLLGLLDDVDELAPTVLELGCGSGALAVALVKRGAARVRGIDLSPGMLAVAVRRAEQSGVADQVSFGVGDGAIADADRDAHDWVVLDRVICCYPDYDRLLGSAAATARRRVAFTVPTSRGWRGLINRVAWLIADIPARVLRRECATFVHDLGRIERILATAGFEQRREARLGLWHAAVWERSGA